MLAWDSRIIAPSPSYTQPAVTPMVTSRSRSYSEHASVALTFGGARQCGLEWDEWVLAMALLQPNSTVLELGARFGTTSCVKRCTICSLT